MFTKNVLRTFLLISVAAIGFANDAETDLSKYAFQTLDGREQGFVNPSGSATLLLFVSEKRELKEAFRIATIIPQGNRPYNCYVLLDLSDKNPIKAMGLRNAANQFFKGETSRQCIAILETDALQNILEASTEIRMKSALIDSLGAVAWTSNGYPGDTMIEQLSSVQPIQ